MMRLRCIGVLASIVVLAAACGASGGPTSSPDRDRANTPVSVVPSPSPPIMTAAATPTTLTVGIVEFDYEPAELRITVGDTVMWDNQGDIAHTATSRSGGFDSGTMQAGDTFAFTPTSAGTIAYACSFHSTMQGTIVVSDR